MPQFLEAFPEAKNTAIQGTLVATILMAGALTSLTSGSISDKFSRKRTIMIGAIVAAVGCFLEAGSVELWMLILGRLIAGAGEGLFVNTISVYLVEISPPAVRGSTSCTFQLLITVGIVIGYFMCYFSVSIGSSLSFRIPFIVQGIACCTLAIGVPFIPHSPRWLVAQGREEEAWHVISLFDPEGAHLQREKIQEAIQRERGYHQSLRERMVASEDNSSGYLHSCMAFVKGNEHIAAVMDAFGKGRKGRTVFGVALMGLQQLSGIDAVLFYAPVLFTQAGLGSRKASFLASGVSGIVNLLAVIPAQFYLVDKWGRRPCCITGGLLMCVCMTVIGSMYASGLAKQTGGRWTVIAMIYLFIAVYAPISFNASP
ncbi:hypothetical protein FRC20_009133 [Serendipita sp. 405]|nr:hypothetical protein FRC20_009133 [Serendipita sp. 405]